MKTKIISVACLLSITLGGVSAQSIGYDRVPQAVRAAFASKFASAKQVKWDKEEGSYEASFELNGKKKSAVFTPDGKQTELEAGISVAKLPDAVRKYMNNQKKSITEAAEITDATGKKYYEAEAGGKDYLFNTAGKPVQKIGQ